LTLSGADESSLRQLAVGGIAAFPPALLDRLAPWCWDRGETTGDARYCSISRTLQMFIATFDEQDESGGVEATFLEFVSDALRLYLPSILDAATPEEGTLLARVLRLEVAQIYREHPPRSRDSVIEGRETLHDPSHL
jgi:hypothetical protein